MADLTSAEEETELKDLLKMLKEEPGFLQCKNWPTEKALRTFRRLMSTAESCEKIKVVKQLTDIVQERDWDALFLSVEAKHWVIFILDLAEWTRVKQFKNREDQEYGKRDFEGAQERLLLFLRIIDTVLKKLHLFCTEKCVTSVCMTHEKERQVIDSYELMLKERTDYAEEIIKAAIVDIMLICFTSMEQTLWTKNDCVDCTKSVMKVLLEMTGCRFVKDILCGTTEYFECKLFPKGIYSQLLSRMQPHLTKELWKRNPATTEAFCQSLLHVQMPELGGYLDHIFPLVLLLIDDYMTTNKLMGLKCLEHLIKNTSSAELKWYGRVDVLYDALFQQLYSKETPVIEITLPCLLAVLKIAEVSPLKTDQPRVYGRYDKVFVQVLTNMEMENLLVLRQAYTKCLPSFLEAMGITVVRHSRRLLRVFESFLEQYDSQVETAQQNILKTMIVYIQETWPRISCHCEQILKCVLKFVYDISVDETMTCQDVKDGLLAEATKCLIILKRACSKEVMELLEPMKGDNFNVIFDGCVREILESQ
ncbi:TELO2-interacting protein 2-like [Lineus longissimus]|uniref:TELO2-interacting protein 2-like n=1 Tax=Lineus longissimus TaxID=88925 RepID=UPI00315D28C7